MVRVVIVYHEWLSLPPLSTYGQTFVYNHVYKTNVPANYIDVADYNDTCGMIHDIGVYYDNKDQQTYGLVEFKKLVWV
jgi:hypothetical protein